ncbi:MULTISPECIES: hypothetical protein [Microbulbifer]|uniref:hypothetical protein n=1 Tax=Microbulbifer TaxID=48073 RepID=UPI001E470B54|nr:MULTISPECIES: hypothetical protein [Microbulbifer]UHQ55357.1 hypothetical protein LVE68_17900 [Microbulbifer sp. YPW16]
MLSTIQIVSGSGGTPWTREQRQCVLEIRSEHKLNDPTSFSILMHDLPDRQGVRHRLLAPGRKVAVLVRPRDRGEWHVLFQGKVSEVEEHQTQGGVGSTILYRGQDIRTIMAARSYTGAWSGQVDAVMKHLIEQDFAEHHVDAPENNELDEEENPLGQNSNNLDFLRTQAIAFGHNFWVSYARVPEATPGLGDLNPLDDSEPSVTVTPKIHWARSPYFEEGGAPSTGGVAAAAQALPVLGGEDTGPISFKVNVNRASCPNVTSFEVMSEGSNVQTMPEQSGSQTTPGVPSPPTNPLEPPPDDDTPGIHFVPRAVQPGGDGEQVNEALEQERAFDRKVKLSTTLAMLKKLCIPNELATLEGVPEAVANRLFRISDATHVIRIDGHWMDAVLESDGREYGAADETGVPGATGEMV